MSQAINFSDTTPGAPTGGVNVRWQQDGNGNISAYASKSDLTGASVSSVFGRTGDVVAQAGDYTAAQVTNAVSTATSYANPAWISSLDYSKLTNVPPGVGKVSSVFGRTGDVVAQSGDYSFAQISGAPTSAQIAATQTPWLQNINAAGYQLQNAGWIGIANAAPTCQLDITAISGGAPPALRVALSPLTCSIVMGINTNPYFQFRTDATPTAAMQICLALPNAAPTTDMLFCSYNGAWTERVRITNAGNVGIGTGAPTALLHIYSASSNAIATCETSGASSFAVYRLKSDNRTYQLAVGSSGTGGASGTFYLYDETAGAYRMLLNASGNVGIGTVTPGSRLDVVNGTPYATTSDTWMMRVQNTTNASGQNGLSVMNTWATATGKIFECAANYNGSATGYFPVFTVDGQGQAIFQTSTGVEAMRVTNGNVGIRFASPTYNLHLSNDSAAKLSTNYWTIVSDARLKRNARPFTGGLDVIRKLQVIEAEYNGENDTPAGYPVVSFDAAAVRALVPRAVGSKPGRIAGAKTDVLDLNIHEIMMHLFLAVQQLDERTRQWH